jgi:TrmH family RNA methyltransferase
VLSKSHIKYIQSLHHKKFRQQEAVFFAEGDKLVIELLQSGKFVCKQLIALQGWLHENEILIRKYFKGECFEAKDFELEKISALSTPNHVLAVFEIAKEQAVIAKKKITLLLDDIQDPGNLGTIIRIADWFGIEAIICSDNSADVYNPKVVQSTMGSIARVNIVYMDLMKWLQKNEGIKIYATALKGDNVTETKKVQEAIIIIGNESKGVSYELLEIADEKITIPKIGKAESLNAAVATGIILSHII